jgi:hypothetical protein
MATPQVENPEHGNRVAIRQAWHLCARMTGRCHAPRLRIASSFLKVLDARFSKRAQELASRRWRQPGAIECAALPSGNAQTTIAV